MIYFFIIINEILCYIKFGYWWIIVELLNNLLVIVSGVIECVDNRIKLMLICLLE